MISSTILIWLLWINFVVVVDSILLQFRNELQMEIWYRSFFCVNSLIQMVLNDFNAIFTWYNRNRACNIVNCSSITLSISDINSRIESIIISLSRRNILIVPITESWTLSVADKNGLCMFERWVLLNFFLFLLSFKNLYTLANACAWGINNTVQQKCVFGIVW